jgi:drug/metabolite transporter (DMT)-like permease
MAGTSIVASVLYGLAAALTWGVGDFSGGFATRRARVFSVVLLSQTLGIVLLALLAVLTGERPPAPADVAWGAASGIAGLVGIAALYRAMALGQMGIVAPVSGVITAALPVVVGALTQGLPSPANLAGFALAFAGVWLISRSAGHEGERTRPAGIGLAVLSGLGFGCFLVLIAQAEHGTVFWPLTAARAGSLAVLVLMFLVRRPSLQVTRSAALPIVLAGTLDSAGNLFFVLASQAGRLDIAGVLSSLYPATTVLLALIILREGLKRWQVAGVICALLSIPLISLT